MQNAAAQCSSISCIRCSTTLVNFAQRSNALCSAWHQMQCTPVVENAEWSLTWCALQRRRKWWVQRWSRCCHCCLQSCPAGSHANRLIKHFSQILHNQLLLSNYTLTFICPHHYPVELILHPPYSLNLPLSYAPFIPKLYFFCFFVSELLVNEE